MIERYAVTAGRIRQEIAEIARTVERAERAFASAQTHSEDQDLYLDSAALNMHDFYSGMERIFRHIATTIDNTFPSGSEWHHDLLRQMAAEITTVRPSVLSGESLRCLDEYLRFRHIVRNVYAFVFDPLRIKILVGSASGIPATRQ
jgi:hypothetical protein